jgi:N-formylglutamate amidohydrolase
MSPFGVHFRSVEVNRPEKLGPVIVSIPHAGRIYPQEILDAARVSQGELERLEDSWCDLIAAQAVSAGATVVKALYSRAVADCNRAETQMAAAEVAPDLATELRHKIADVKERSGLGVVPTRLAGCGVLWKKPINKASLERRLDMAHRPYHEALAREIDAAEQRHGTAVLIDLHSMPSIRSGFVGFGQSIIVGDRFGTSSGGWLANLALDAAANLSVGLGYNRPYAGGYILTRHAQPEHRRYGVQLEFDRNLYLNSEKLPCEERLPALQQWFAEFIQIVAEPARWPTYLAHAAE